MSEEIVPARPSTTAAPLSPLRRHWQKLLALGFWMLLLGGYQWYAWHHGLSPFAAAQRLVALLSTSAYGPLLFIAIYTLRPLVLFSATVLSIAAGFLFGPLWGIVYTLIGSNLSATVAYAVGRFFGHGLLEGDHAAGIVRRYAARLRDNSFMAVLTMRFVFLPYDLVNYLAGFLRIQYQPFMLATILGSLPGTFSFVLAGASIHGDLSDGVDSFDPRVFAASAIIFVSSLLIARYVRRREHQRSEQKE
ncbi:MAG TPA: TVP38/TMEM64 family protein [Herpetosiphonaceae bacterium]